MAKKMIRTGNALKQELCNPRDYAKKRVTIKERENNPLFIKLSHGNKKLRENSRVSFLVWNIPAVITCPYRTPHCEGACYARKAENAYPTCLPSRKRHFEISRGADFVQRMTYTIETELDRPKNKNKMVVFRIHESGDFYNRDYVEKWLMIMRHFEDVKNLVFVAYTKSVVFFDGVTLPENFQLLASVWDDTSVDNWEIITRNNFRIYTAYNAPALELAIASGFAFCPCNDCGTCGKCWNNFTSHIACKIH